MSSSAERFSLPAEVKELTLGGKCVAFVGSGLSAGCYPSWDQLINDLCERCGVAARVTSDSPVEAFLDAAQEAKDAAPDEYFRVLGETFGRPANTVQLVYDALLAIPFQCYLTINFDPLLALKARTVKGGLPVHQYPALDRKYMAQRSIHYLHGYIGEGCIPREGAVVLARKEFVKAYSNNSSLLSLLVSTLENDHIVFIGCRLHDLAETRVFPICEEHQQERERLTRQDNDHSPRPKRFILLQTPQTIGPDGGINEALSDKERQNHSSYYMRLNIEPVWYPGSGGDHSSLRYALEGLAGLRQPKTTSSW